MPSFDGFLDLAGRAPRPRSAGLTHVLDKGLSRVEVDSLFEVAGDYIDIVKLGWGTPYVTRHLDKKLELYRSFDVPVVCGGTLFEAVLARDKLDEYRGWLTANGISHIEVSDTSIDLPHDRKLELISELSEDFVVLSEVGSKDAAVVYAPYQWVEWIQEELAAGAWKVIAEARETGTAGIFRPTGEVRTGLIDEIAHEVDVSEVVFEAPTKDSQAWFIQRFGPDVNLGNIPPDEVIPLETLRVGLRADTLRQLLLPDEHHAALPD
jgi:phosphosulfolactate synthase